MEAIIILVLIYAALVAFFYVKQDKFIYFPNLSAPDTTRAGVPDMRVISTKTKDELTLGGWYKEPSLPENPTVLMFHGNGGNIEIRGFKARAFIDKGYGVLMAEYRGYSTNKGVPSEQGFYEDARAWLQFLTNRGVAVEDIVLYGESLGTGVAVQLASETPGFKAVVLEMPYTSLSTLAQGHMWFLPVKKLMRDQYDSLSKIKSITAPVVIMHGTADTVVPYEHGHELYKAANQPKKLLTFISGTHMNLYSMGAAQKLFEYLDTLE